MFRQSGRPLRPCHPGAQFRRRCIAALTILSALASGVCLGQAAPRGSPATEPPLPLPIQMKKTVVFLEAECLHDFTAEVGQLDANALSKMSPEQVASARQNMLAALMRLRGVKQSMDKLSADESATLVSQALPDMEIPQMARLAAKMSSLSEREIEELTREELALLPRDTEMGTGFIVLVPDTRLPESPGAAKGQTSGFGYLVTNRHVAQPGIDNGKPCRILNFSVLLNRKGTAPSDSPHAEQVQMGRNVPWHFSTDDSVDLAVSPFRPSPELYDFVSIPVDFFVTENMVEKREVVEGDPVLFSGLFVQSFSEAHTLEPIVRSGILAMVPNGKLETTLHKPGRIYLTEAHAFAGNSGSPVFVETTKFTGLVIGGSYKLLGAISGEVIEGSDLTLHVTTSYSASISANSDVSVVVPAGQIRDILYSQSLQTERDAFVAQMPK